MDNDFEALIRKIKDFEGSHVKIIDDSIFRWFRVYGLPVICDYCYGEKLELECNITKDDIRVTIEARGVMLIEHREYPEMLRVLRVASSVSMEVDEENKVTVNLWYRGWKWETKEECKKPEFKPV